MTDQIRSTEIPTKFPMLLRQLARVFAGALVVVASPSFAESASGQSEHSQPPKPIRRMDMSKSGIEIPLKRFIKSEGSPMAPRVPDISKMRIEAPVKSMSRSSAAPDLFKAIESRSGVAGTIESATTQASPGASKLKNLGVSNVRATAAPSAVAPVLKVRPGLVTWHQSMADATRRSRKSGKPVLVFHMMGSLDDRFC